MKTILGFQLAMDVIDGLHVNVYELYGCDDFKRVTTSKNKTTLRESLPPKKD